MKLGQSQSDSQRDARSYRIAIIGTGFAGICMAINLLKEGIQDFVLLEKSSDIGGTWRDNTYPGAACDVVSHLYSFSFEPNPNWSRMFAPQKEIQSYLMHCVEKYNLRPYILFNQEVQGGTFDEKAALWNIHVKNQLDVIAPLWVNGMGPLNRAVLPKIAGINSFEGTSFHTSHWNHNCDLTGKRVAVIGTGASAIQVIPNIASSVKELHVFQRSAAWVLHKPDRKMKAWEKSLFSSVPITQRLFRWLFYWINEITVIALAKRPALTRFIRLMALKHMKRANLSEELQAKLTPKYTIGCKRILPTNNYYPTFKLPHVHLHTDAIEHINSLGIQHGNGILTEVDVIIYATGFEAAEFPATFVVRGKSGQLMSEVWKDGPEAYLGTTLSGFPNMFFIIGPNTGLGHSSMVLMIEAQVAYIMSCVRTLEAKKAKQIEVKSEIQISYNKEIQSRLKDTVWNSGCVSWYRTSSGKNTSIWPGFTFEFISRTKKVNPFDYNWTV